MKRNVLLLHLLFCAIGFVHAQISRPTEFVQQPFDILEYDASLDLISSPLPRLDNGMCLIRVYWKEEPQSIFPIHLRDLTIDTILVNGSIAQFERKGMPADDSMYYAITLPKGIKKGDSMIVMVHYSGMMGKEPPRSGFSWGGVYSTKRILYSIGVGFFANYVGTTQHWLPCYDHPSDKALLTTRIKVQKGLTVVSNGLLKKIDTLNDGLRYTWSSTIPMATYLMTFAVDTFQKHSIGTSNTAVYAIRQDSLSTAISFSQLPRMISTLEKHFGPYPFESVGYVLTPTGSMEHQTMISIDENVVRKKDSTNSTILHELSHQWFGDKVTPLNYGYSWLSESFATYCESIWAEELRGQSGYIQDIASKITEYVGSTVSREGVLPLEYFPRLSPSSNFPRTIYIKGAAVLGMLRYELGDSLFFTAMRTYLERHAYGNATTEDLKKACEDISGKKLDWFFDQWVKQKGWPRIQIDTASSFVNGNRSLKLRITQVQPADHGIYEHVPLQIGVRLLDNSYIYRTIEFSGQGTTITLDTLPEYKAINVNQGNLFRSLVQLAKVTKVEGENQFNVQSLQIYPNPGRDMITVEYPLVQGSMSWTIMNMQGKTIRKWKEMGSMLEHARSGLMQIDVSSIPSGMYTIMMVHDNVMFRSQCTITH